MNDYAIFAFALALIALVLVAAVSIIWLCRSALIKLDAKWAGLHVKLSADVHRIEAAVERTTNSKLAAEVDALRGALDVYRASTRKELGALWGRLGGRGATLDAEVTHVGNGAVAADDELQALLQLQSAPPVRPSPAARRIPR